MKAGCRARADVPHLRAFAVIAGPAAHGSIPLASRLRGVISQRKNFRKFIEKPREFFGNSISGGRSGRLRHHTGIPEAARAANAGKCGAGPGGRRSRTPRRGAAAKQANPPGYSRTPRFPLPQLRGNAPPAPRPGAGRLSRFAPPPPPGKRRPTGGLSSIPHLRERPATGIAGRCRSNARGEAEEKPSLRRGC